jgi:hypothetical protein
MAYWLMKSDGKRSEFFHGNSPGKFPNGFASRKEAEEEAAIWKGHYYVEEEVVQRKRVYLFQAIDDEGLCSTPIAKSLEDAKRILSSWGEDMQARWQIVEYERTSRPPLRRRMDWVEGS